LSLLFLLSLRLSGMHSALPIVPARLRALAAGALLLVIGQITLGGWVSSNYAAVACTDFPTCHGEWWPQMDFANAFNLTQHDIGPNYLGGMLYGEARTAIHVAHRLGALTVTLVLLALGWQLWRNGLARLAGLLLGALALQIGLGISNVLLNLPLAVAVAHNAGGALLLLVCVLINHRLYLARRPYAVAQPHAIPRSLSNTTGGLDLPRA
jgi:cytochrome c oxidase assembly protein subunit 15